MASTRPRPKSLNQIKSNLMKPATTSHFDVFIVEPSGASDYSWSQMKKDNGIDGFSQELLHLSCSEASLPGSSFLTHEITNDFVGVTEKHAYRRGFDGTIDLTFYVMTSPSNVESAQAAPNRYLPIRFFEAWMKYIAGEKKDEVEKETYAYRMRYPKEYYGGLSVIKYERDYKTFLSYKFKQVFPTAIASIPVSYDRSELLKCTVTLSYTRYFITDVAGSGPRDTRPERPGYNSQIGDAFNQPLSPQEQALQNAAFSQNQDFEAPRVLSSIDEISRFGRVGDRVSEGLAADLDRFGSGNINVG